MTRLASAFRSGLSRISGNNTAEDAIHALANDLRRNLRAGPPFEPRDYARSLGVNIERGRVHGGGALDGWSTAAPRIVLPNGEAPQRRHENFTIAHELGHFMIRNRLGRLIPRALLESGHPEEEYFCNLFAAELLVPRALLLNAVHKFGLTPEFVLWLADYCEVNPEVVVHRFGDIYRERFIGMLWQKGDTAPKCDWSQSVPRPQRPFELPGTGKSTVEAAFESSARQSGWDTFLAGPHRIRWQCLSLRIASGSVLTVGTRSDASLVLGPVAPLPSADRTPKQMILF